MIGQGLLIGMDVLWVEVDALKGQVAKLEGLLEQKDAFIKLQEEELQQLRQLLSAAPDESSAEAQ